MLPTKAILQDQLRQQMLRVSSDDLEQQMEVVRYFVRSSTLRIAACDVTGVIPLMQVSDYLTWLAEVVIEYSVNISWEYMLSQYGEPQSDGAEPPAFVVVAYGKLGGIELGYKSDLDLVFLYNGASGMLTNGARSIDNSTFFVRLGQRIIHILTTMVVRI
jgi:[glutamine synthetase] adenylyltransferase / [glutamine synthetase]-adenylyl-L-tyrosine phosphorylase